MSVSFRQPVNRLSEMVGVENGISVSEAIRDAQANLDASQARWVAAVDEAIRDLQSQFEKAGPAPSSELIGTLYVRGSDLIGLAGACGFMALSRAAYQLCYLLDQFRSRNGWDSDRINAELAKLLTARQAGATTAESARLAELHETGLLDSLPEASFDRIARLAHSLARPELAFVNLLDNNRQWVKAKVGSDIAELPREWALCDHVVKTGKPLWVEDAQQDVRFASVPPFAREPFLRFYAGAPITLRSGERMGAVCVLSRTPREFDAELAARLADLAALATAEVQRRLAERRATIGMYYDQTAT